MEDPRGYGLRHSTWRDGQLEAVEGIEKVGKKIVIVQGPTGVGKTSIVLAVLKRAGGRSFILTPNITLQDQYVYEGNGSVVKVVGRHNFECVLPMEDPEDAIDRGVYKGLTVDEAPCYSGFECIAKDICGYFLQRKKGLDADLTVHNYHYWLPESTYVGGFSGGNWVVADEGHLLDNVLSSFYSVNIPPALMSQLISWGVGIPGASEDLGPWIEMGKSAVKKVRKIAASYKDGTVDKTRWNNRVSVFERLANLEPEGKWIVETDSFKGITIRPIWPPNAEDLLLTSKAEHLLILSATILNPVLFTKHLGIKDYEYIDLPYVFPIDTRPIFYRPAASVTQKTRKAAAPALASVIDSIMNQRKGERGIIHTTSFDLLESILPHIKSQSRIIPHLRGKSRMEVVNRFKRETGDYWLMSPSVAHGEDFAYGLAHSQIIVKVPFPNLGDKVVRVRANEDQSWYSYETAKALVQMIGRVTRARDDYGETWIVDSRFEDVEEYLPQEIRKAVR